MRRRGSVLVWLLASWLVSPLPGVAADPSAWAPQALPETPVDDLEPAVRQQIETSRQALDRLLQDVDQQGVDALRSDLVAGFGDLGELYLLYDRPQIARLAFDQVVALEPTTVAAWYYLGVLHQDAGDFAAAVAALEHVLAITPDDVPSLLRLGESHFRLRQLDAAEAPYRRALTLDPSSAAAHYGLGRVADARRRYADAIEHFSRASVLQPDADAVFHPLALAHRRAGDLDAAKAAIARAGSSLPTFADPLMRALRARTTTARAYLVAGTQARRRGRLDLALDSYRRAVEVAPDDPSAHYNLGAVLGELGRIDEAEAEFRATIALDPTYRDAHFNLGVGLRARGQHGAALDHFSAAIEADPADQMLRLERGVTLIAAGRGAEGRAELQRVRATEPRDAEVLLLLARYLDATGDPTAADQVLDRAWTVLVRPEERAQVRLRQAERAVRRADRRAAAVHLDDAVRLAPDLVAARLARAQFSAASGRYAEATTDYAAAETLEPKNALATSGLARSLCRTGQFASARDRLVAGLSRMPEATRLADQLARLLATSPDPEVRDGDTALGLANRLANMQSGPEVEETRAMALAANSRFDDAIAIQQRLLSVLGAAAPPAIAARVRSNLARYRRGQIALPPW